MKSEKDFNMGPIKHFVKAPPTDKASLDRIAKLCPSDAETFKKAEMRAMADTCLTLNALVKTEVPEYAGQVKLIPEEEQGPRAKTACGGRVKINSNISLTGRVDSAHGELQGHERDDAHRFHDPDREGQQLPHQPKGRHGYKKEE